MRPEPWEPTDAQMAAYRAREIELAKSNICSTLHSRGSTHGLLHSVATLHAAMQALLAARPNRFARDPRKFSALPRVKAVAQ